MQMTSKQIEELVSQVVSQLAMKNAAVASVAPKALTEQDMLGTGGTEPFDLEYKIMDYSGAAEPSNHPRVNRILRAVHSIKQRVDDERALLYTEAHKKFGGSLILKNARILKYILENVSIRIYPDELIVGEIAAPRRNAPVFPEFSYNWIVDELQNEPFDTRVNDNFQISDECKKNLLDLGDYWCGNTIMDAIMDMLTEEELKGSSLGGEPVFFPNLYIFCGIGHLIMDYESMLTKGYKGVAAEIKAAMAKLDMADPEYSKKMEFHQAQLICIEAAGIYFKRFAALAREMSAKESDPVRAGELATIASNCDWVSENPPRTYWEAMQLFHLGTNITEIESNGHSISYGRFDLLMNPFYEADMKAGRITKSFAEELIECFYIKIYEMVKIRDKASAVVNTEVGIAGTLLLVGGCDKNGVDATNDVSYMAIEAHVHTLLPDPWFAVRWSINSPWEWKVKVVNSIKVGTGQPKIFNDEAVIPASLLAGRSLEDARNYNMVGCVEINGPGNEYGAHDASYFSMPKVFELAINDGRTLGSTTQLGPKTGSLADMKSIEDIIAAYDKQMAYWVDRMCSFINTMELNHGRLKPLPYLDCFIIGCTEKGLDVGEGGAVYNYTGPQGLGCATVADCLANIDYICYKEKRITPAQMLDCLEKNWVGYEAIYQLANSDRIPHFGNDNDYVDELCRITTESYIREVSKHRNVRGGWYLPGVYSVSANVAIGMGLNASADGRLAGEAVSNSLGPVHNVLGTHDVNGPTAMALSAAKINHTACGNGTLTNVRFTPSCCSGDTGRDNMVRYVETYFQHGAQHVQFNICNTETLRDAQKHPENYPNLLVRIAGYSAYFVRLSKPLQDDLIGRKAYDSFD